MEERAAAFPEGAGGDGAEPGMGRASRIPRETRYRLDRWRASLRRSPGMRGGAHHAADLAHPRGGARDQPVEFGEIRR